MKQIITLEITHPEQRTGTMTGFRFLWAFLVSGYRSERHCQACFYGKLFPHLSTHSESVGVPMRMELSARHPFAYICGVSSGPLSERRVRNLHLPLRHAEGGTVAVRTYNGYTLRVTDAEQVAIPALPDDWNGLERAHTRCKNFQFAVAVFGYPVAARRGAPLPSGVCPVG